ncbi:hypothetical protein SAMN05216350_103450 [Polaromonas sp. YR568]|uniref:hypothetical protein n=1 Tax=Polaromonas sp. YR568 TaxID=1855301 RepID=UPI0008EA6D5A|nr:hypothetical protein [Polaromonas sp. YR568]SFU66450.1 hypothetical protein SAMN05216350_103450 [Polaromonas sp. YR568]
MKALLAVLVASSILMGCATDPHVLEEANLTVGMMGELKGEIDNYRKVQQLEDKYRNDFIAGQRSRISTFSENLKEFTPKLVAPAVKNQAEAYKRLREVSEIRAARIATGPVEVELKLVEPLPDVGPQLSAAQVATSPLASELGRKERLENIRKFAKDVHDGIKDNLKKIEDANGSVTAAKPPVQTQVKTQ